MRSRICFARREREREREREHKIHWRTRSSASIIRVDSRARSRRRFLHFSPSIRASCSSDGRDARCDPKENLEERQPRGAKRPFAGCRLRRGRAFAQAGSSAVSARYRYAVHTFPKRSSHRPVPSAPRCLLFLLSRSLPLSQLFSRCLAAGIASHRVFSCGSRLTEGCISHNVARGLPQCCACSL